MEKVNIKHLKTEKRNQKTTELDLLNPLEIITIMNEEDYSVVDAVGKVLKDIEACIKIVVEKQKKGGRLIYIGAGTSGRLGILDAVECVPTFSTKDAQSFPITNHGMGTRSLATILTFKAYCEWKEQKSKRSIHTTIALEEPEVHLHPQAQRVLITQIKKISAQKIISTHSPYIASETNIEDFVFFRKTGDTTNISQIDKTSLSPEDRRKINQRIMKTKGEFLFSRVLLFFEGETESDAFPIYAGKYW